jgi:O-antigen biosynthesis protein
MTRDLRRMAPNPRGAEQPDASELAVLLDASTLAVVGWSALPVPAAGDVLLEGHPPGAWRAYTYADTASDRTARTRFFALIGLDNIAQLPGGQVRVAPKSGGKAVQIPSAVRIDLETAPLIEAIASSRSIGADIVDFMRSCLAEAPFGASRSLRQFMQTLLGATSQQDGFVEILGQPECGGALIQGWSFGLAAGKHALLLDHGELDTVEAVVGRFPRADLVDTAHGVVAYLKDATDAAASALRRVYHRTAAGYGHLELVESLVRPEPPDVAAHLARTLTTVKADAEVRRALKRVCRPRFGGVDTSHNFPAPVRAAVDRLLYAPGAGFLLSGWLLDPRRLVRLALLKSTGNFYCRLHDSWHRTQRADVSAGFTADGSFAPWLRAGEDMHGFLVFVPRAEPIGEDEQFYLELVLEDESCAFLPVAVADRVAASEARAILESINIDDPAFDSIVPQHLGPAIFTALAQRPAVTASVVPLSERAEAPIVSIVIPVESDGGDLDINLARLVADPDIRQAEIIFVTGRTKAEPLVARLRKQMEFFDLRGITLLSPEPLDRFEALELGAHHARAELLLFLSESALPRDANWLSELIAEIKLHPGCAAVSPTLLYEDYSIRYAGTSGSDPSGGSNPGAERLAGYSQHWLTEKRSQRVTSIAPECCLVRRQAFAGLNGFSREFAVPDFKAADFALRATASGAFCLWTPKVTLFALDPDVPNDVSEYWLKPARRVDAWRFGTKWTNAASGSRMPVEVDA